MKVKEWSSYYSFNILLGEVKKKCMSKIMFLFFVHNWATSWQNLLLPYANNTSADQPASAQSDQRLCFRCLDSIINTSSCYSRTVKILASLISWAGRFESYLVGNHRTGFLVTWVFEVCVCLHHLLFANEIVGSFLKIYLHVFVDSLYALAVQIWSRWKRQWLGTDTVEFHILSQTPHGKGTQTIKTA